MWILGEAVPGSGQEVCGSCICIFYSVLLEPKTTLKIKSTFYKFKQNWGNAKKPSGVRYHPGSLWHAFFKNKILSIVVILFWSRKIPMQSVGQLRDETEGTVLYNFTFFLYQRLPILLNIK